MNEPLEELYFNWLFEQTHLGSEYLIVCRAMFRKEYVWLIANDDNRAEHGKELRLSFLNDPKTPHIRPSYEWMHMGCSFLEMLIALAKRIAFEMDESEAHWFEYFMVVLDIQEIVAAPRKPDSEIYPIVDEIVDRVIWRTYSPSGHGGLFPLRYPDQDQREVEIWYQANAYLLERE